MAVVGLGWIAVLLLSLALTALFTQVARRRGILDIPVARSAHQIPVPRGGGIAIVTASLTAFTVLALTDQIPLRLLLALLGGIPIAVLGWLDDLYRLDIRWRLPVHLLVAGWAVICVGSVPVIPLGPWTLELPVINRLLAILALVWLLNLYNFMDGIDGLAASEAVSVALLAAALAWAAGDAGLALAAAMLAAASLGFLAWNWAPARLFMGDVGSGYLGYLFGVFALFGSASATVNPWVWVLLLGTFVVDASVTLARRITTGQRWYEGHDTHAYQYAARHYGSHRTVVIGMLTLNVVWLAPLALLVHQYPRLGVGGVCIGVIPLVLLSRRFHAGDPRPV